MRRLRDRRVGPAFVPPGRPWQNVFVESFNGKLRDECLNREWFRDLREARVLIEQWREFYNHRRRHEAMKGGKALLAVNNTAFYRQIGQQLRREKIVVKTPKNIPCPLG